MNSNAILQSKTFRNVLYVIGIVLAALLIFRAGISVGYRKANFSYRWGENYHRNFGGPRGGFMRGMRGDDFANPHGAFGKIIKLELPQITIQDRDAEKIVIVDDNTVIRRFRDTVEPKDLRLDDFVVVVGSPNGQGQVEAKLIRLMPPPPDLAPRTSTQQ